MRLRELPVKWPRCATGWAIGAVAGLVAGLVLVDVAWTPVRPEGVTMGHLVLQSRQMSSTSGVTEPLRGVFLRTLADARRDGDLAAVLDAPRTSTTAPTAPLCAVEVRGAAEDSAWLLWSRDGRLLAASFPRTSTGANAPRGGAGATAALEMTTAQLEAWGVHLQDSDGRFIPGAPDVISVRGQTSYRLSWVRPSRHAQGGEDRVVAVLEGGYLVSVQRFFGAAAGAGAASAWLRWPGFLAMLLTVGLGALVLVQRMRRDSLDFRHGARFLGAAVLAVASAELTAGHGLGELADPAFWIRPGLSVLLFTIVLLLAQALMRDLWPESLEGLDSLVEARPHTRAVGAAVSLGAAAGFTLWGLHTAAGAISVALGGDWAPVASGLGLGMSGPYHGAGLAVGSTLMGMLRPALAAAILCGWIPGVAGGRGRSRPPAWSLLVPAMFLWPTLMGLPNVPAAYVAGAITGLLLWLMWRTRSDVLAGLVALLTPALLNRAAGLLFSGDREVMMWGGGLFALVLCTPVAGAAIALWGRESEPGEAYVPGYVQRITDRERFRREMEIARSVQEQFLPKEVKAPAGLDVAFSCESAVQVGGDYLEFVSDPESGRILAAVGDVAGKGVSATFYMTLVKGMFSACASSGTEPASLLKRVQEVFERQVPRGMFVTMGLLELDLTGRRWRSVRAGHPPVILARGGACERIEPAGIAVGVAPTALFSSALEVAEGDLRPGDRFLLASDGLFEAMNTGGEEFGIERAEAVMQNGARDAADLLQKLQHAVTAFTGPGPFHDDRTLCVMTVQEPAS